MTIWCLYFDCIFAEYKIDTKSVLVHALTWHRTRDKPLPEPMETKMNDVIKPGHESKLSVIQTTMDLMSGWWFNLLWQHRSGSTLDQVMACCLMAPSHYLNQCWLIIKEVLWHSPKGNFTGNAKDIYPWFEFGNYSHISQGPMSLQSLKTVLVCNTPGQKFYILKYHYSFPTNLETYSSQTSRNIKKHSSLGV